MDSSTQYTAGQHAYLARAGAPEINARPQTNGQHVERRPVHEIEVEVVLELRCIQYLFGQELRRTVRYAAVSLLLLLLIASITGDHS